MDNRKSSNKAKLNKKTYNCSAALQFQPLLKNITE
jgi:hypothetical protein